MTSGLKLAATAVLGLSVLTSSTGETAAKPLSSEICIKLVEEHAEIAASGIEAVMDADPENSATAVNKEQLARIERFLFIEGQIRFRCPEIKLPGLDAPKPSEAQAAEFERKQAEELKKKRAEKLAKKKAAALKRKQTKKQKGPAAPLPARKPKPPS